MSFRFLVVSALLPLAAQAQFDPRTQISAEADRLVTVADVMSAETYEFYRAWDNAIDAEEQGILFQAEGFAASAKLFAKLSRDSGWYTGTQLRTNISAAFTYLNRSFVTLQQQMNATDASHGWRNRGRRSPLFAMDDIEISLRRMDRLFQQWPSAENPAYLANTDRYVQNPSSAAVYMIRKRGVGEYEKAAFVDLEAFYAFHQKARNGRGTGFKGKPWDFRATVGWQVLASLPDARQQLTNTYAPGDLLIEGEGDNPLRPGLAVLMVDVPGQSAHGASQEEIAAAKGCSFTPPRGSRQTNCWDVIYRVPPEVIRKYSR